MKRVLGKRTKEQTGNQMLIQSYIVKEPNIREFITGYDILWIGQFWMHRKCKFSGEKVTNLFGV